MNELSNVLLFVGFVLPPLIDLINRYVQDSASRFWVSVAACTAVGAGVAALAGTFSVDAVFQQAMVFIGQAQISYKLWENTDTRRELGLMGGENK